MKALVLGAAVGLLATPLMGPAPVAAQPAPTPARDCFFTNQFQGWPAPDDRTIIIRVGVNEFFRLDLAHSCSRLTTPNTHLITKPRGSNNICTALDWDLSVSQGGPGAIPTPCIVRSMTKLSPAEVKALPPKYKP